MKKETSWLTVFLVFITFYLIGQTIVIHSSLDAEEKLCEGWRDNVRDALENYGYSSSEYLEQKLDWYDCLGNYFDSIDEFTMNIYLCVIFGALSILSYRLDSLLKIGKKEIKNET